MILLTPYKRYYEQIDGKTIDITDEIPFDIPETWEWCRLHEVCAENSVGIVIRPTQYYTTSDKGIPAFRNANIKPNKIDDTNWIYLSYYGIQENPRCIVHENNLLISRSGNAGTCCVATKKYDGYGAVDILLISLSSFCSSFFISYCINSPFFQHKISQNNRGVALSHIGTNTVAKILLPLPPLAEQKRIVGQIENLLKCADEIDQESTTLEKSLVLAKQKVLDLAIRGKLVPQNPEDEPASELLKRIKAEKEALVRAGNALKPKKKLLLEPEKLKETGTNPTSSEVMITVTMRTLMEKLPTLPRIFHLICRTNGNGVDFPQFLNLIWVKPLIDRKTQATIVNISAA